MKQATTLKQQMRDNGIPQWKVANEINVSEYTLVRNLRDETRLTAERRTAIENAIKRLKGK